MSTVVAVVVAYNRRELLLESIQALKEQTRPLDAIIVIDNASTDGTADAVRAAAPEVELWELERNTGGAGGFAVGLAAALQNRAVDWVWAMDDDTVPTPTALVELLRVAERAPADTDLLGSRVVWTDGLDHPMNTPRPNPFARAARRASATRAGVVDVRTSSFVSMFVRADAIRRVGLPIADYFIWNDDFEYSARLVRGRRGLAVPASVVVHKTNVRGSTDADPGARFFNEVRNKVWLWRFSSALSPLEKIVYGASTIRRWIRTVRLSSDRPTLRDGFRTGWSDGWRSRPRPNSIVLADLGRATEAVRAVEEAAVR
ncbi:glycosyltransferase family 2 protein [Amnibacterium flavum]|uniref:glycosyltransferase family 2 protein n=1 Tax=Amnibacterium flavum TaxID=2173173 RepID=UPI001F0BD7BE|nr:glycosyltransferase family 2 protein [Amnibacterium flavum]